MTDPQTGVSVDKRAAPRPWLRRRCRDDGAGKAVAKTAADGKDVPIDPLGSGSDYSSFLQHLGLASLNVGYGGEGDSGGVYHSAYDTYEHHSKFVDPGFAYAAALAKTTGPHGAAACRKPTCRCSATAISPTPCRAISTR